MDITKMLAEALWDFLLKRDNYEDHEQDTRIVSILSSGNR
jgi:hypothetical protein